MADEVVTEMTPQEMVDWANAALDRQREQQEEIERLERIEIKYNNLCNVLNEQVEEIERLRKLVLDGDTTIGGPRAALWKENERLRAALERAYNAGYNDDCLF